MGRRERANLAGSGLDSDARRKRDDPGTLEWEHEGRSGGESTLKEASHAALMQHNYSNVK